MWDVQREPEQSITEVTRRGIADYLTVEQVAWEGRLDEPAFLSRIWDLTRMPSHDRRYSDAAGDIWQHRVNNSDGEHDWVFHDERFDLMHCPDEAFVRFLAEMLHPVVRYDPDEVTKLAGALNGILVTDGWELVEARQLSGRPVFEGRRREAFHQPAETLRLDSYDRLEDPHVLREHLERIDRDLTSYPAGAIGASKELVETVLKLVLDDYSVRYKRSEDLSGLYKLVQRKLRLDANAVDGDRRGSEAAVVTLRALVTTLRGLVELRNAIGSGHGQSRASPALTRHARLAFNTAVAICEFILDTWHVLRANDE